MKSSRIRSVCAFGLLLLVATACGAPIPDNTPGQEPNQTIRRPTTVDVTVATVSSDAPDAEQRTTTTSGQSTPGTGIELEPLPVDLDAVLSQLDQLLDDLETSTEGVPQS